MSNVREATAERTDGWLGTNCWKGLLLGDRRGQQFAPREWCFTLSGGRLSMLSCLNSKLTPDNLSPATQLRFADFLRDEKILNLARDEAFDLVKTGEFDSPPFAALKRVVLERFADWLVGSG